MEYKSGLRAMLALAMAACAAPAVAQEVNKCQINGRTVYQQNPCPGADIKVKQVVVTPPKTNPYIGMLRSEIEKTTWGEPMYKNQTTTATSFREQWVYFGHRYIYVRDGVVTAIQE
mgnify:CR=1 FL=1